MNNLGIQVRPLWYPCHKQNYLKKYEKYNIVNAEYFYKRILCIPSSYFLKSKHIEYISKTLKMLLKKKLSKIKIIAEIGVNHNGRLSFSKKTRKNCKKVAQTM